jgi:hypothetical protein
LREKILDEHSRAIRQKNKYGVSTSSSGSAIEMVAKPRAKWASESANDSETVNG